MEFDIKNIPLTITNYKGKIYKGLRWQDNNGDNIFILTVGETKSFYKSDYEQDVKTLNWHGYHYCNYNSNEYRIIQNFNDFVKDCEFDLMFNFIEEAFKVSDLNNNNIGEVFVLYNMTCASDVSPLTMKLILFENSEKYLIRGSTLVEFETEKYGGEIKVDKSFEKADNILKESALKLFKRHIKYNYEQSHNLITL